ncbi:MAG: protein translocase subunit SecD [Firmicutes bacterium]|nr:protein translocase subunit SecD [Bacillota bacterium]
MKKILAIVLAAIIGMGWFFSLAGAGSVEPLKDQIKLGLDMVGGVSVLMEAQTDLTGEELKAVMNQTQLVIENRVNEMGLSEPVVTIEGDHRIRVELPGAENADEAIKMIGDTAQLLFITADEQVILTGSNVKHASASPYQGDNPYLLGTYAINLEFDSEGADLFYEATKKAATNQIVSAGTYEPYQIAIILDDMELSAPAVEGPIPGGKCQITGNYGSEEAMNLAALIRGGALPVALKEVETQNVGPSLGMEAAKISVIAGVIGITLIMVIMVIAYKGMGLTADIALLLYVLLVLWTMVALKGVLTLPGIAGIILSVGMAVDANVIIFARIKEENNNGKSIRVSVESGFKRAMGTIIDSQVTTMIAAVVLYLLGTGSVRGFALTLLIGIIASIFTAVVVTQVYLKVFAESRFVKKNPGFLGLKHKVKTAVVPVEPEAETDEQEVGCDA